MKSIKICTGCLCLAIGFSCKEVYKPTVISSSNSYMVIEGVLNAGRGPTNIRLSRTFRLDDSAVLRGERNAQVIVEGKDNSTRQLAMSGDGIYTSPDLNLVLNSEYRLRVRTAGGKEYVSDYVVARYTPPVDSLEWELDGRGVQIYVNTHDASNNTWYYRWDFDETWEIRTHYISEFKYVNSVVSERAFSEMVSTCWKYGVSGSIAIGSSARLSTDIIRRAPLALIPNGDEKLAVRYSILLHQYAMDKKAYGFYELMKKNTESLGSVFDAQPSELRGNIHNVSDPGELVIGFITSSVIEEKRFFITGLELGGWRYSEDCPEIVVLNNRDSIQAAYSGGGAIFGAIFVGAGISHYKFSTLPCVDCTFRGGSLIRPSYW